MRAAIRGPATDRPAVRQQRSVLLLQSLRNPMAYSAGSFITDSSPGFSVASHETKPPPARLGEQDTEVGTIGTYLGKADLAFMGRALPGWLPARRAPLQKPRSWTDFFLCSSFAVISESDGGHTRQSRGVVLLGCLPSVRSFRASNSWRFFLLLSLHWVLERSTCSNHTDYLFPIPAKPCS